MECVQNFKFELNDNTDLVDIGMYGLSGIGTAYLLKAGKSCLIDGGTREGSAHMINTLKTLNKI